MTFIPQILFFLLLTFAIFFFTKRILGIRRNILMGQAESLSDQPIQRWKNLLLLALGQQKMFKNPTVAILHLLIYLGFIIVNIEMLEIVIDGLFGSHRILLSVIPALYPFMINTFEGLAFTVILVCIVFLARRNILRVSRFRSNDLSGWPSSDANFILIAEIILMMLFLLMNAADTLLQEKGSMHYAEILTGNFMISSYLHPLLNSYNIETLTLIERVSWWGHIIGVLAFLNYLPWSKHLHIILAFPNAYFKRLTSPGKISNMPSVQREVQFTFNPELASSQHESPSPITFGAKDVHDLSWKNILDAYSCTECGRCSAACPANQTGKRLSPRKIMMSTRDRAEEIGNVIDKQGKFDGDGRSLLFDHISEEELRACTTCNACVEECPVSINPVDIIMQLRRYLVMEKSSAPGEWTMMFGNVENNFAPWKFSPEQRTKWINQNE
ncbi:MAG: 4Fe-4S dicluster domain-containing protein [bacterium]|jgi:heterodisulfide reductase subunit C